MLHFVASLPFSNMSAAKGKKNRKNADVSSSSVTMDDAESRCFKSKSSRRSKQPRFKEEKVKIQKKRNTTYKAAAATPFNSVVYDRFKSAVHRLFFFEPSPLPPPSRTKNEMRGVVKLTKYGKGDVEEEEDENQPLVPQERDSQSFSTSQTKQSNLVNKKIDGGQNIEAKQSLTDTTLSPETLNFYAFSSFNVSVFANSFAAHI